MKSNRIVAIFAVVFVTGCSRFADYPQQIQPFFDRIEQQSDMDSECWKQKTIDITAYADRFCATKFPLRWNPVDEKNALDKIELCFVDKSKFLPGILNLNYLNLQAHILVCETAKLTKDLKDFNKEIKELIDESK